MGARSNGVAVLWDGVTGWSPFVGIGVEVGAIGSGPQPVAKKGSKKAKKTNFLYKTDSLCRVGFREENVNFSGYSFKILFWKAHLYPVQIYFVYRTIV